MRRARSRDINFHPVVTSLVLSIDPDTPSLTPSSTTTVASLNAAPCPQSIARRIRPLFVRDVRPRRGPEPCSSQWEYGTRCEWQWHVHAYSAAFVWNPSSSASHAGTNWTVCSTQRCHVATEPESNCRCLSISFAHVSLFLLFFWEKNVGRMDVIVWNTLVSYGASSMVYVLDIGRQRQHILLVSTCG